MRKIILTKISEKEFIKLGNSLSYEFINGTLFEVDTGNIVAFEYFYDDCNHDYFKVELVEVFNENIKK